MPSLIQSNWGGEENWNQDWVVICIIDAEDHIFHSHRHGKSQFLHAL